MGLCLLEDTPAFRRQMPAKVYEYLAVGLPVLATSLPRLLPIVGPSGTGALVADGREAAVVLRRWHAVGGELEQCRDAAVRWADEHLPPRSPFADAAEIIGEIVRR